MSTETTDTPAVDTTAVAGIMTTYAPKLVAAWKAVEKATENLTKRRLDFGGIVNRTVAKLLATGMPASDAQAEVLASLPVTVEWSTVQGWTRAHGVYVTLDADTRDAFGIDGLTKLATVPGKVKAGDVGLTRQEVATVAVAEGMTSDRDVRLAVQAARGIDPDTPRKSKVPTGATAIESSHAKYHVALRGMLDDSIDVSDALQAIVTAAAMIGCRVGRGGKSPTKSQESALATLTYIGALPDDDTTEDDK